MNNWRPARAEFWREAEIRRQMKTSCEGIGARLICAWEIRWELKHGPLAATVHRLLLCAAFRPPPPTAECCWELNHQHWTVLTTALQLMEIGSKGLSCHCVVEGFGVNADHANWWMMAVEKRPLNMLTLVSVKSDPFTIHHIIVFYMWLPQGRIISLLHI